MHICPQCIPVCPFSAVGMQVPALLSLIQSLLSLVIHVGEGVALPTHEAKKVETKNIQIIKSRGSLLYVINGRALYK